MDKKVLVLCTGNSCRSIIAEALINKELNEITAYSSGVSPSGRVNPNAIRVLKEHGIWREAYHSKEMSELKDIVFDLVVTVCDNAKETCPVFSQPVLTIHEGFKDPDGKEYEAFEVTYEEIRERLLPRVEAILMDTYERGKKLQKNVFKTTQGVKIAFSGAVQKQQIVKMVENCATGACECMNDETKEKINDMQVSGKDGEVHLDLSGEVTKEEIEAALERSKVINS